TVSTLFCGGIACCVSWASIYPLYAAKMQVQVWAVTSFHFSTIPERTPLSESTCLLPINDESFRK
ncbi:hypothetical protein BDZ91DRAFT_663794, partial [Kalaharituber pfeilii]